MVDRQALIAELRADGLRVTEWTDPPRTSYEPHTHACSEVRVVLEGEITFFVGGLQVVLQGGDRIDFRPGETHAARVGPDGATYLAGTGR